MPGTSEWDRSRWAVLSSLLLRCAARLFLVQVKLHLWDTAGQERFRFLCQSYYRNSVGVVVAYSVLDRHTFHQVEDWVGEARKHAGTVQPSVIIVGCKLDLVELGCRRQVRPLHSLLLADHDD